MAKTGISDVTAAQKRAIVALLSERDIGKAAMVAHVGYRTLCRWLTEPKFTTALRDAEDEVMASAVRKLSTMVGLATDRLAALIASEDASVALPAIRIALTAWPGLKSVTDFASRLTVIEGRITHENIDQIG